VINPPVYPPFYFRLSQMGQRLVEAPLRRSADPGTAGSYDLDPDAVDQAPAGDDAGASLLCSPPNPGGRVWAPDQLLAIANICVRRGATLVVDEIHAPLALPGARHVPFLSLDHAFTEQVIVLTSASKAWNIPGLKCGVAVAGDSAGAGLLTERWDAL